MCMCNCILALLAFFLSVSLIIYAKTAQRHNLIINFYQRTRRARLCQQLMMKGDKPLLHSLMKQQKQKESSTTIKINYDNKLLLYL